MFCKSALGSFFALNIKLERSLMSILQGISGRRQKSTYNRHNSQLAPRRWEIPANLYDLSTSLEVRRKPYIYGKQSSIFSYQKPLGNYVAIQRMILLFLKAFYLLCFYISFSIFFPTSPFPEVRSNYHFSHVGSIGFFFIPG